MTNFILNRTNMGASFIWVNRNIKDNNKYIHKNKYKIKRCIYDFSFKKSRRKSRRNNKVIFI